MGNNRTASRMRWCAFTLLAGFLLGMLSVAASGWRDVHAQNEATPIIVDDQVLSPPTEQLFEGAAVTPTPITTTVEWADPTTYTCASPTQYGRIEGYLSLVNFSQTEKVNVWVELPDGSGRIGEGFSWFPTNSPRYTGALKFAVSYPASVRGVPVTALILVFDLVALPNHGERTIILDRCGATPTPTQRPNPVPTLTPTVTPRPSPTSTLTPTTTPSPSPVPPSPTPGSIAATRTTVPTRTPSPQPTVARTAVPQPTATKTPTVRPTSTPTKVPTVRPTSTPTKVPTPKPGSAAYIANTVKGQGTNCRTTPSFSGGVILLLTEGTRITVRGSASNGWTPITCNGKSGWVSSSYLTTVEPRVPTSTPRPQPTKTPTPRPTPTKVPTPKPIGVVHIVGTVNGGGTNCRETPSFSGKVIVLLKEGVKVSIWGNSSNGWQPVICNGKAGWVSNSYTQSNPPKTPTPAPKPAQGKVTGTGGAGVNCRASASSTGSVIVVLAEGQVVNLNGAAKNGWQPVTCGGKSGYVSTSYITKLVATIDRDITLADLWLYPILS